MAVAVLERDAQNLTDSAVLAEQGDAEAASRCQGFARLSVRRVTSWQWVIHGETREFREGVVEYLCEEGEFKKAVRFALCGRGDVVKLEVGGEGAKVCARGCGCRFCPRCSRRSGQRFLRRIASHLESRGHGEIWHFVLTQPVWGGETVGECRKRWEGAWTKWYRRLRAAGMESALLSVHLKPRGTWGWHVHGHCIVEWKRGVDVDVQWERLEKAWQGATKDRAGREKGLFGRFVCGAGDRVEMGSFGGQGEFWKEPETAVARVLQYAVRDVVQGCESWVEGLKSTGAVREFVEAVGGAKLHRLYGAWRTKVAVEAESDGMTGPAEAMNDSKAGEPWKVKVWVEYMGIEKLWDLARSGDGAALAVLKRLSLSCLNHGKMSVRLSIVAKSVSVLRCAG